MVSMKSDKGIVRSLNEDYADFYEGNNYKIYVVADGMGGHNAGEVASKMAVESVIEYINKQDLLEHSLEEAILYANRKIYDLSIKEKSYGGMGTTLTACLVRDNIIEIANVGDSCCFGLNEKGIIKLTKDHSLVQELIDSGSLTEEEGRNHPKKNIITRALGTSKDVVVDIFKIEKNKFKVFLLCSDGLINEVSKEEIFNIITNSKDLDQATNELVSLAKEQGGRDNITVLLFGGEV
ncbi:Stp1/IreP family PP2C-type Ser/Thr phosphatase [Clostridium sp. NSJ-49]|uniref:Stp1/IreP family PP2C-type Ser/Thr phosphatase n=1 Tax=Clostridium TaxID=1485 RepID=UPI00164B9F03|nr:Stp1/IreP family PP2C-type Ser/Thr phosphatase [Clostridium sp. NSJ-49]MBC5623894.1 Stp1/IreP family PP2C-type Ser/Thr phosphatase [Clostridium sp. NSJ-49]MDU6340564.1 Stp1/IreP family PP2C-type Ser/Thr phosphatase [Clostridium sp.]